MNLKRSHIIQAFFVATGLVLLIRLFFIQILSDYYSVAANKNIVQPTLEYPYRGLIYDRNGNIIVSNTPVYNVMIVPKDVKIINKELFCRNFNITEIEFEKALQKAKKYSYIKPSLFIKWLSKEEWARIEDYIDSYLGFYVEAQMLRNYHKSILANVIGYIGEVDPTYLASSTHYYKPGELIGITGLEKQYESVLRGQGGISYKITNSKGITKGSFKNGTMDIIAIPGENIITTIDVNLQAYGEFLMQNKIGSIVAIEPKTGDVLALISSPPYDPNLLVGKNSGKNFNILNNDKSFPLFNRPVMAKYAPGSIFKLVQTLIGLQEGVISPNMLFACDQTLLKCRNHPSQVFLKDAIKYSCNPYFYRVFRCIINQHVFKNVFEDSRYGLNKWCSYVTDFGFGSKLGIDIPGEKSGFVPGVEFYDKMYGFKNWKTSTIRSLDIGQGELLATPLQMANLAVIIANRGFYYPPHLVKKIGVKTISFDESKKHTVKIDTKHFDFVIACMYGVAKEGTAKLRMQIKDIDICAKTGTVENFSGNKVDHAVCIAFAPKENPQIAVAVYIENVGWGSGVSAAIASLIIEKYLNGVVTRQWLQDYALGNKF